MSESQSGNEHEVLEDQGESGADRAPGGEGGGGAVGDESYTQGGARGSDAERGQYYDPENARDGD
jgi:hypothetical protein